MNAPGSYLFAVKYAGVHHIVGSPFKVNVKGDGQPAVWNEQAKVLLKAYTESANRPAEPSNGKVVSSKHGPEGFVVDAISGRHVMGPSGVICMGGGLQKAFVGHQASFVVDASQAEGWSLSSCKYYFYFYGVNQCHQCCKMNGNNNRCQCE